MSGPGMGFTGPQIGSISGIPNQNIRLGQMLQGQIPGQGAPQGPGMMQPLMGAGGMAPGVMPMMQPPQMMPPHGMPNTQFPLNPGAGGPQPPFGLAHRTNPGMLTNGPMSNGYYKVQNRVPGEGIK